MLLNRDRANAVMDRHGLKGLVVREKHNVYYLSDYWESLSEGGWPFAAFAVLPRDPSAPPTLVVPAISCNASMSRRRHGWKTLSRTPTIRVGKRATMVFRPHRTNRKPRPMSVGRPARSDPLASRQGMVGTPRCLPTARCRHAGLGASARHE